MRNFKNKPIFFRVFMRFINIFYHKRTYTGVENIKSPTVFITNHSQIHAPLTHTLFFPTDAFFWCISDMTEFKKLPSHALNGFWPDKPKSTRWLYKIVAHLLAPLSWFFKRANTIPVYHDSRVIDTYKITLEKIRQGHDVIICPENWTGFDGITNDFHDKFVDIARMYYKEYGKIVTFTPMYTCPALKTNVIGAPIAYNPDTNIRQERQRIVEYIKSTINKMAKELPPHIVVPFSNVGEEKQPMSR